jgi:hypothetical protein
MIEIFPQPYNQFICPQCKSSPVRRHKIIFQGIHLVADLECTQCGFAFYQDFPVGHGVTYAAIIDKKDMRVLSPAGMDWYTQPLVKSLQQPVGSPVTVAKKINGEAKDPGTVIFFNCLDAWYGHVLLKLMNLQFYHDQHPAHKKIVLVPAGFTWMVPAYVNEVWTADIKLRATTNYYLQLEAFIIEELKKYETVYHASGYSHPPLQQVRVEDFFRQPAFDMERFLSTSPQITFIYREDRLWIGPFLNRVFNFLNHRKIKFAHGFFYGRQVKNINRLAKKIKERLPQSRFIVCGLGNYGRLAQGIADRRATAVSEQQELDWCGLYAGSHLVIGIHGSNMLIPSALAAAWLEILPDDRVSNISQDLFCKYAFNQMVFLGRFASPYDPLSRVADIACSMITDYESFRNHQQQNYGLIK